MGLYIIHIFFIVLLLFVVLIILSVKIFSTSINHVPWINLIQKKKKGDLTKTYVSINNTSIDIK